MNDPRDVIVRPVVSEKSYALSEKGVYIFVVPARRTRSKSADQSSMFSMSRSPRSTLEPARQAQAEPAPIDLRQTPDTKRAMVTLASGQSIPLFETS